MSICSRSSFLRCTVYVAGCTQQVASVDVQSNVPLSSAATRLQRTRTRICLRCLQQGMNHLIVSLLYPWQLALRLLQVPNHQHEPTMISRSLFLGVWWLKKYHSFGGATTCDHNATWPKCFSVDHWLSNHWTDWPDASACDVGSAEMRSSASMEYYSSCLVLTSDQICWSSHLTTHRITKWYSSNNFHFDFSFS